MGILRSRAIGTSCLAVLTACLPSSEAARSRVVAPPEAPLIQVALLLDTSNSMDGLIDQARSQLWKVVNELASAQREGAPAELQVALYEYGNNDLPATEGYIRQVVSFTADLDRVSEELFALTTNGGEEYCGRVIGAALDALPWSRRHDALKSIFIAGNEPFTQGDVDPEDATRRAIGLGVTVNTIHCGPRATGISGGWERGARIAEGSFMTIDQDRAVAHVAAPQDAEIARLGEELNATYVPYGDAGSEGSTRQSAQDSNATSVGAGAAVQRGMAKASRHYKNPQWDLVDAVERGDVKLDALAEGELPEEMKGMPLEDQKRHLTQKSEQRARLKDRIQELGEARKRHVARVRVELGESEAATLDLALIASLREQAQKKDIQLGAREER
jgi:hypothetical protein